MKTNHLKLVLSIALLLLMACSRAEKVADNGFDQICQIYTHVLTDASGKSLTQDEKMGLIYKDIHKQVTSKSALDAFDSFMAADPQTRYSTLKKVAEYELKHSWDCPIINTIR